MTVTIRKAEESDVSAIAELAAKLALASHETDPPEGGFLVSGFTEAEYSRYVASAEHFYVCTEDGTITGFLLAYASQAIDSANSVESLLKYAYLDEFVVIKQIAVDPGRQRTGVGARLYRNLIDRTPNTALLAAIVLAPPNPSSVCFHERFKFRRLLDVIADDGLPRGIWHRSIRDRDDQHGCLRIGMADQTPLVDRLMCQRGEAAQLYCHEDNLNWCKVGGMLTMVPLLWAGLYFLWSRSNSPLPEKDLLALCVLLGLGVIVHLVFLVCIKSGLDYMQAHKNRVIELEEHITGRDRRLTRNMPAKTKGLSKTAKLLYVVPHLLLALWCAAAVALLLLMS